MGPNIMDGSITPRVKRVIFQEMMKNMTSTTMLYTPDLTQIDTWVEMAPSILAVSELSLETKMIT